MGKQRMTALDVRASVEEMRANLIGLRLINLYDIQAKMFLFRFGDSVNKKTVLVENGMRMHLTTLEREKPKVPSQFTLKLRKHVRAWRLESITQLSHDRTIDLCFGVAGTEGCFHIIVELFSKGNVILTDHAYTIMMLLRTHKDEDVSVVVRGVYPVTTPLQVTETGAASESPEATPATAAAVTATTTAASVSSADMMERAGKLKASWDEVFSRSEETEAFKSMLSGVKHFGPSLAEHIVARTTRLLKAHLARLGDRDKEGTAVTNAGEEAALSFLAEGLPHFDATKTVALLGLLKPGIKKKDLVAASGVVSSADLFAALLPAMQEAWTIAEAPLPEGGYLIKVAKAAKAGGGKAAEADAATTAPNATETPAAASSANTQVITSAEKYDDFSPILLAQYTYAEHGAASHVTTVYQPSFGAVCDTYFLSTETEQIEKHNKKQNKTVLSKREKFERDFQRRVSGLEHEQELNRRKGELIIFHADMVNQAIDLINGALAAGIQWDALKQLLRRRHAEGHEVAYMIHELFLERNSMTVLLEQELYDDEDDGDVAAMEVEVNLAKTAHANAADYFAKKKANQVKLEKTLAAQDKAAAGADRKGQRLAAKQEAKKQILVVRTREWWEKMHWFITSAGDIVLQGKDIQTTEIIVRRLMRVGDFLVHCDVDGALPCLVRPLAAVWTQSHDAAPSLASDAETRQPIALVSLEEAGAWCVSRSSAFEQKINVGSWWVYASQLKGGTASGTYLYDGEKHHLKPRPVAMGCALLCRVARDTRTPPEAATPSEDASKATDGNTGNGAGDTVESTSITAAALTSRCPPWPRFQTVPELSRGDSVTAVPADPSEELQELPSVETLRPNRPRGHGDRHHPNHNTNKNGKGDTQGKGAKDKPTPPAPAAVVATAPSSAAAAAHESESKKGGSKKTTRRIDKASKGVSRSQLKQEKLAARNERIAIEQAFLAKEHGSGGDEDEDREVDLSHLPKGTFDPKKPPPPPQLTKHQRKKLKKIQAKYADQDEEDRVRGAMLNGNTISKVQQQILERQAEEERLALEERRAMEKAQRAKDRKAGRLRYLDPADVDGAEKEEEEERTSDSDEEDEEDVELVDSFTDEGEGEDSGAVEAADPASEGGPSGEQDTPAQEEPSAQPQGGEKEETESNGTTATTTTAAAGGGKSQAKTNRDAAPIALANDKELKAAVPFYTPYPAPTDTVLHVVCVCAPQSVLASYPYRVELAVTSGAKKGQVAEKVLEHFKARASGTPLPGDKASKKKAAEDARREARRAMESSTSTAATTATGAVEAASALAMNTAVVKALETLDLGDIVEQLRANAAVAVAGGGTASTGKGKRR